MLLAFSVSFDHAHIGTLLTSKYTYAMYARNIGMPLGGAARHDGGSFPRVYFFSFASFLSS